MTTAETTLDTARSPGLLGSALCWLAALVPPLAVIGGVMGARGSADLPLAVIVPAVWAGVGVCVVRALPRHPHPKFGAANGVTALRAAGTVVLGAVAIEGADLGPAGQRTAGVAAAVLLALDGVDGLLARRLGTASAFGARFDVEVDAAMTLVLAGLVWQTGAAGPLALAVAAPYYVFVVARGVWPWLAEPPPPSLLRKAVCVAQIGGLLALLILPVPAGGGQAVVIAILLALALSFGRDIRYLRSLR